jgi:hypothetical protein
MQLDANISRARDEIARQEKRVVRAKYSSAHVEQSSALLGAMREELRVFESLREHILGTIASIEKGELS